jgi:hypothetical protein
MVWAKAGSDTLNTNTDTVTVSTSGSQLYVGLSHQFADTGTMQQLMRFNGSSGGTAYAYSRSENGGSPTAGTSTHFIGGFHPQAATGFVVSYHLDVSGDNKLVMAWGIGDGGTGASNDPERREVQGKYTVTTTITSIDFDVSVASNFATGSNLTVLGSDGTTSMIIQDGAIYYDTDLNKEYVLYNNTWTEV